MQLGTHKSLLVIGIGVLMLLSALLFVEYAKPDKDISTQALTTQLSSILAKEKPDFFFSPLGLSMLGSMTASGTSRATHDEVVKAFNLPEAERLGPAARSLLRALDYRTPRLEIANAMILQGGDIAKVSEGFKSKLRRYFGADVFSGDVGAVNSWVSRATDGAITEVVKSFDSNQAFVLLNAIYFKGEWVHKFMKEDSFNSTFYANFDGTASVTMMSQNQELPAIFGTDYNAVSLPYRTSRLLLELGKNDGVNFVVVAPHTREAMTAFEADMKSELPKILDELHGGASITKVDLIMPSFKSTRHLELKKSLEAMGVNAPFQFSNDFNPMGMDIPIRIEKIFQDIMVEVDEEGTKAVVVSTSEGTFFSAGADSDYKPLRVDKPFYFFIFDKPTGTILVVAKVSNP